MEILYRNTKILLKTIPENTLLFRIVVNPTDDLRGVPISDGKRCLTPNYNVFFHPNPFIGSLALKEYLEKDHTTVYVYKLKNDIKVIALINPSKFSRRTKNEKGTFVKRCSTVKKGCLPNAGKEYDPCLSDTIIKKYPDVVGIMAVSIGDTRKMKQNLKKTQRLSKYFKFVSDSRVISGVPELILHPLKRRPSKDLIISETDVLEQNYEQINKFGINNIQAMEVFMNKHAVYDPDTAFFKYI